MAAGVWYNAFRGRPAVSQDPPRRKGVRPVGLFDDDLFDFDGDGKTDLGEEFLAYMMFEEMQKEDDEDEDDFLDLDEEDEDEFYDVDGDAPSFSAPPARDLPDLPPVEPEPAPAPDEPVTAEAYARRRSNIIQACLMNIRDALIFCVIPGAVIGILLAMEKGSERSTAAKWGIAVAVIVILLILFAYAADTARKLRALRAYREKYLQSLSPDEQEAADDRSRKITRILAGVVVALVIALIAALAVRTANTASVYRDAETLIAAGAYDEALTTLETIRDKGYHDTDSLLLLCRAHQEYDRGRAVDAYYTLQHVQFNHLSQEQRSEVDAFRQTLKDEYDAYIHRMAEQQQAEYERIQSLPFPAVGQFVTKSQLDGMKREGSDSSTFSVKTTIYLYVSGNTKYRLWITDYNCIKQVVEVSGSGSGGSSGKTSFDTGPSVDGFSSPEDFYEWYPDDFVDFEDAEAYYYDHGGE